MVLQCCVRGCETVAKNGLHSFPSNKLAAERWIIAMKASNLMDRFHSGKLSHSYQKVCKRHFKADDFQLNGKGQAVVKPDSTPSLFLPDAWPDDVRLTNSSLLSQIIQFTFAMFALFQYEYQRTSQLENPPKRSEPSASKVINFQMTIPLIML